jgi:hypothetical protein
MSKNEYLGTYSNIHFEKGVAKINRGQIEPAYDSEGYYHKPIAILMCRYKSLFKKLFEINVDGEEICQFFEKSNLILEIEQFFDGKTNVNVVDLMKGGIIYQEHDIKLLIDYYCQKNEKLI